MGKTSIQSSSQVHRIKQLESIIQTKYRTEMICHNLHTFIYDTFFFNILITQFEISIYQILLTPGSQGRSFNQCCYFFHTVYIVYRIVVIFFPLGKCTCT